MIVNAERMKNLPAMPMAVLLTGGARAAWGRLCGRDLII